MKKNESVSSYVERRAAERPSSVRVLGKPITVRYHDEGVLQFENNGLFCHDDLTIDIKNKLPLPLEQEVVLHELLHAISDSMNVELTEHQVTAVAAGIVQVLRDNKSLLDYFRQE